MYIPPIPDRLKPAFDAFRSHAETNIRAMESIYGEQARDPLVRALFAHTSTKIVEALGDICRAVGVRFFSVSHSDLICLEDINLGRDLLTDCDCGKEPAAWWIASRLFDPQESRKKFENGHFYDCGGGSGCQAHMAFFLFLSYSTYGVYDVRGPETLRVAPYINQRSKTRSCYDRFPDDSDLGVWLEKCGALVMSTGSTYSNSLLVRDA